MDPTPQQIDQIFSEWDHTNTPGCALAVIRAGHILYKRGYGMANLELGVPIRPESIFDIGSVSKQFTAMSVVLLARQGVLSLDDEIQKYLPEIPFIGHKITIRHFLNHTSGMRDYLGLMFLAGMPFENDYQEKEVIELIARQKELNFIPGSEYLYSNSGYFLLAEIVQRVSGKNLRDFAEENIFKPLGMTHTHFHNNFREVVPNRASAYSPSAKEGGGYFIDMGIFDVTGDGAVYTSVEDLYLWDQNFYHNVLGGGGSVHSRQIPGVVTWNGCSPGRTPGRCCPEQELIELMETTAVLNNGEAIDYACGLRVSTQRGLKVVRHGGSWYGYHAEFLQFPEQQFSVICLSNLGTMDPGLLAGRVADLFLGDKYTETEPPGVSTGFIQLADNLLREKCGFYLSDETGDLIELFLKDGKLCTDLRGNTIPLEAVSTTHFVDSGGMVGFEVRFAEPASSRTRIIQVDINHGYLKETMHSLEPVSLTPGQRQAYAGKYYSPELEIMYSIAEKEDKLMVSFKNFPADELKPAGKELFKGTHFSLEFLPDAEGKPGAFQIHAGRVKNIRFERRSCGHT